ncbi:MAG: hypothetical protein EOM12_15330 [Verrucomicrobiae bacterium]|nr:hypothetical protein [Verrucomicrobiae bacterium]
MNHGNDQTDHDEARDTGDHIPANGSGISRSAFKGGLGFRQQGAGVSGRNESSRTSSDGRHDLSSVLFHGIADGQETGTNFRAFEHDKLHRF